MSHNNHKAALAIMEKPDLIDKDRMLWWLAKTHPAVFVAGARLTSKATPIHEVQLVAYHWANKLDTIKGLRQMTPGLGLKEAKDIVDRVEAGHSTIVDFRRELTTDEMAALKVWFTVATA